MCYSIILYAPIYDRWPRARPACLVWCRTPASPSVIIVVIM